MVDSTKNQTRGLADHRSLLSTFGDWLEERASELRHSLDHVFHRSHQSHEDSPHSAHDYLERDEDNDALNWLRRTQRGNGSPSLKVFKKRRQMAQNNDLIALSRRYQRPLGDVTSLYNIVLKRTGSDQSAFDGAEKILKHSALAYPETSLRKLGEIWDALLRVNGGDIDGAEDLLSAYAKQDRLVDPPLDMVHALAKMSNIDGGSTIHAQEAIILMLRWLPRGSRASIMAELYQTFREHLLPRSAISRILEMLSHAEARGVKKDTDLRHLGHKAADKARRDQKSMQRLAKSLANPRNHSPRAKKTREPGSQDPHRLSRVKQLLQDTQFMHAINSYNPGAHYPRGVAETTALFTAAARLAGLPELWATSEALFNIYEQECLGYVGIPNYTYGTDLTALIKFGTMDLAMWKRVHQDLKDGKKTARSSATGLGQLLLSNVDTYYPARRDGIGVPIQEAAGMLAYIKDRYGSPEVAWAAYGTLHEGY
ncbi:MAG: hypothetical protein R3C68_15055 [Myxococcota bacterium]